MKRLKSFAFSVVVFALAFVGFFEARYYRAGLGFVRPTRTLPTAAELEQAKRISTEVTFETKDGLKLKGDLVAPKNGVVVVMIHGLGENRMHFLPEAELLERHGYGALIFDGRGHGDSEGDVCTWGQKEQLDVEAAVAYALAHGASQVVTLGFSIGSSAVMLEAANDPKVKAIIIEAIWPTIDEEMNDKMGTRRTLSLGPAELAMRQAGLDFSKVRPVDHLAELGSRPKLFIAGTEDKDTPVAVVKKVFDATPEPKQLWVIPGAAHALYAQAAPADYERTLIAFLDGVPR